ncbi:MAG: leucine-rich repeat domain-containing protein [Clostridia bacterium]|nr:leucine-rich repeat domain-containing protein [Clostridia bacterium]
MGKIQKLLITIITALCILTSCVAVSAADVETGSAGAGITWNYDKNAKILTISGSGAMDNFSGSGAPWSAYSAEIETVILSEGITSIGNNAFAGCKFIETVTVPGTVTSIGSGVFEGCQNIVSVTIPKSVTSINSTAFGHTTPKVYCAPGSEASIFASNLGLEISEIKNGEVYSGACGNTVTWSIDEASGVMTVYGDGEMSNFPDRASVPWHMYRTMIKVVKFDGNITSIGNNAFANSQNLTAVTLPETLKTIGNNAFENCVAIKRIAIPASTTAIGDNAFDNCASLSEFIASEDNKNFKSENGVLFNKNKTNIIIYPTAKALEEYVVPDTVTTINKGAFAYISSLKKLDLGKGVKTIGREAFFKVKSLVSVTGKSNIELIEQDAFRECTALESFDAGNVKKIDTNAFSYCQKLKNVKLGSVEEICQRAFYLCSSLEKLEFPATLKIFDGSAFNNCSKLGEITVDASNKYFTVEDGVVYNKNKTKLVYAPEGSSKKSYDVPGSVKEIGICAFYNTKADSVKLSSGLEKIDDSAFYNSALTKIVIPDSVKEIGEYAFAFSSKLKNLEIGDSVTKIGKASFSNCALLEAITIPDSVEVVGDYAFEHCKSAKTLKMSKNITKIGIYAFYKCENITPLKLSSKVDVGTFAFKGCKETTK